MLSASSWSCYMCTFSSDQIDELKLHMDVAHLNETSKIDATSPTQIFEQVETKTNQKFKTFESVFKILGEKTNHGAAIKTMVLPLQEILALPRRTSTRPVQPKIPKDTSVTEWDTVKLTTKRTHVKGVKNYPSKTLKKELDKDIESDDYSNLDAVINSINQKEVEILQMLNIGTEREPILVESDEEPSNGTCQDNEVQVLEFTKSVNGPLSNSLQRCNVCPFISHSPRGLASHLNRTHSLKNRSPAENVKTQMKIADLFKASPREERAEKELLEYNLSSTELNLFSSKTLAVATSNAGSQGKELAQGTGAQCPQCPFLTTSKALVDSHINAKHKNKCKVSPSSKQTAAIRRLEAYNENILPLDKSVLLRSSQIPKPKVDKKEFKLQERNLNTLQKTSIATKFQKVTKPLPSKSLSKHACSECTQTFGTLRYLQCHVKTVHTPTESRRDFRRIKNSKYLKYFRRQSSEGLNYHCSICPKQITTNKAFHKHTLMFHRSFFDSRKNTGCLPAFKFSIKKRDFSVVQEMTQSDFLSLFSLKKNNC